MWLSHCSLYLFVSLFGCPCWPTIECSYLALWPFSHFSACSCEKLNCNPLHFRTSISGHPRRQQMFKFTGQNHHHSQKNILCLVSNGAPLCPPQLAPAEEIYPVTLKRSSITSSQNYKLCIDPDEPRGSRWNTDLSDKVTAFPSFLTPPPSRTEVTPCWRTRVQFSGEHCNGWRGIWASCKTRTSENWLRPKNWKKKKDAQNNVGDKGTAGAGKKGRMIESGKKNLSTTLGTVWNLMLSSTTLKAGQRESVQPKWFLPPFQTPLRKGITAPLTFFHWNIKYSLKAFFFFSFEWQTER